MGAIILLLIIILPCIVRILQQSIRNLTTELHLIVLKNKKGGDALFWVRNPAHGKGREEESPTKLRFPLSFPEHLPPKTRVGLILLYCAFPLFRHSLEKVNLGLQFSSVQFTSVAQSCLTLCDPMNRSTPGLPIHHHLPEFTQTHVH